LEDNDFGCENLQIFRNGFVIEDFSYEELCELAVLLTRSLRGQINRDHKMFWSWCSFLAHYFKQKVNLFRDVHWIEAFDNMVDLLLAAERPIESIPGHIHVPTERLKYVNSHLISVCLKKHNLARAQSFAVLEGLLRRKASNYVAVDGTVRKFFTIMEPGGNTKTVYSGTKLNRINDGLRLFNQVVTRDRARICPALRSMEGEIIELYPSAPDGLDIIDEWSNDLFHGGDRRQMATPIVVNIICLLVIDEIEPDTYNDTLPDIKKHVELELQNQKLNVFSSSFGAFPPDLPL